MYSSFWKTRIGSPAVQDGLHGAGADATVLSAEENDAASTGRRRDQVRDDFRPGFETITISAIANLLKKTKK